MYVCLFVCLACEVDLSGCELVRVWVCCEVVLRLLVKLFCCLIVTLLCLIVKVFVVLLFV